MFSLSVAIILKPWPAAAKACRGRYRPTSATAARMNGAESFRARQTCIVESKRDVAAPGAYRCEFARAGNRPAGDWRSACAALAAIYHLEPRCPGGTRIVEGPLPTTAPGAHRREFACAGNRPAGYRRDDYAALAAVHDLEPGCPGYTRVVEGPLLAATPGTHRRELTCAGLRPHRN